MFGGKLNYESRVFVSGQELSGINTIDLSYSHSANIVKPLGYSKGVTTSSADSQKTMSISRDYIFGTDPLLKYKEQSPTFPIVSVVQNESSFVLITSSILSYDGIFI